MSRPRFLADHNLNDHIVLSVSRREPSVDFVRAREVGLADRPDDEVLAFAAKNGFLLVSHDVNTMPGHAYERVAAQQAMTGLFMVRQTLLLGSVVDSLLLVWSASEMEEWRGQVRFLPL